MSRLTVLILGALSDWFIVHLFFCRIPQDDGKCAVKKGLKDIPPPHDPCFLLPTQLFPAGFSLSYSHTPPFCLSPQNRNRPWRGGVLRYPIIPPPLSSRSLRCSCGLKGEVTDSVIFFPGNRWRPACSVHHTASSLCCLGLATRHFDNDKS